MKYPIVLLHGWKIGMTGDRYEEMKALLQKEGYTVFSPDLPGFGREALLKKRMVLDDYVSFVKKFLDTNKIKKAILIGHSFGGRIAAKFTYAFPDRVEKLILTGSPLIPQKLSFKKQLLQIVAKKGKHLVPSTIEKTVKKSLYRIIGENDYVESGDLRETFKAIIAEDISPLLSSIGVPTMIIWGKEDRFVPLVIGEKIAQQIKNSTLTIIPHAGHKLPYEAPRQFVNALLPFLS